MAQQNGGFSAQLETTWLLITRDLSLYGTDQHGRTPDAVPYLHREFKALARTWAPSSPDRHSFDPFDQDVERIVSYATDKIDSAANGVALFACWGVEEFFEAIQLTTPISDNRVYAYNQPHLYHLARLDEQYPRYAAVLMSGLSRNFRAAVST